MRYKALLVVTLFSMFALSFAPVFADPTPTPTQPVYSADELFGDIQVLPYENRTSAMNIDLGAILHSIFSGGGSFFLTFVDMAQRNGALTFALGFLMLSIIAFIITTLLIHWTGGIRQRFRAAREKNIGYQRAKSAVAGYRSFKGK